MRYIFLLVLLLNSCSVKVDINTNKVNRLTTNLIDIGISKNEAKRLSKDIFYKSKLLVKEFDLVSPPLWHNFLVNIEVRKKGLCYNWSDSLFVYLKNKDYNKEAKFHLIGANIGDYWREHNALMITTDNLEFKNSIIIDPWRNSGELFFAPIKDDKDYEWEERFYRERFVE